MPEAIHGHEVMKLMIEQGGVFSRESLRAAMASRFGEDARYETCSAQDMTAETLITFLETRGKFVEESGGFRTDPDKICDHG